MRDPAGRASGSSENRRRITNSADDDPELAGEMFGGPQPEPRDEAAARVPSREEEEAAVGDAAGDEAVLPG